MAYIEVTKVQYLDVKEIRRASLLFLEQINTKVKIPILLNRSNPSVTQISIPHGTIF